MEARAWLSDSASQGAFAGNRFFTTEAALVFVEGLYAAGAIEVLVEEPRVVSEGAPCADTLLVRCPMTSDAYCRVGEWCEEQGPGDVPPGDFVLRRLGSGFWLWWD